MFNPFLKIDEMTDDVLLDKINEVANRVSQARRSGISYNMIHQLEQVYHQLNTAYQERIMLKNTKMDTKIIEVGDIEGEKDE
jgi:hypothetical protein|tara:strand:+ start:169 stop:414 length:246 start_codon:yes stop_codon:yes gene_type:complete